MHAFTSSWIFWAVIVVLAVAVAALLGWGIVWMLALSD